MKSNLPFFVKGLKAYPVLLLLLKQRQFWLKKGTMKILKLQNSIAIRTLHVFADGWKPSSPTSTAGGLWSLKGWYVSYDCQNQKLFHTGLKLWLWYNNIHPLLSLGSLESSASSQKHTVFHKTHFRHRSCLYRSALCKKYVLQIRKNILL